MLNLGLSRLCLPRRARKGPDVPVALSVVLVAALTLTAASPARGADYHVGVDQPFATIDAAMTASSAGDRIVLHSGEHRGSFRWNRAVDIVEADGADAVYVPSDGGSFAVEIHLSGTASAVWDGVDVRYESSSFTRLFLKRDDSHFSVVRFKNMRVTDTSESGSSVNRLRLFTTEKGAMNLEHVEIDLASTIFDAYEMILGVMGDGATMQITDCEVSASASSLVTVEGASADLDGQRCSFLQLGGAGRFVADLLQGGDVQFHACHFAGPDADRGIVCRGFGALDLRFHYCTWDTDTIWQPVVLEKALALTMINCCVPHDPGGVTSSILNLQCGSDGRCHVNPTSTILLIHSTFSCTSPSTESAGIRSAAPSGRMTRIHVYNCIFYLPGSTAGAVADGDATWQGEIEVHAGTNLRWLDGAVAEDDYLDGITGSTLIEADPAIEADHCHIGPQSAAREQATELEDSVETDVDGEFRPQDTLPDLGADELRTSPLVGFLRGDTDLSAVVDLTDPLSTLEYLFLGTFSPRCHDAMDANDDEQADISDVLATLGFLFLGNFDIPWPGTRQCGWDLETSPDSLSCDGALTADECPTPPGQ